MLKNNFDPTILGEVIETLANCQPLEPKFKDHQLQGRLKDFRDCHIKDDLVLIYKTTKTELILIALDNHNNVFKGL